MAAPKHAPPAEGVAQQGELAELLRLEARLAERSTALDLETQRIRAGALAQRAASEAASAAQLDLDLKALEARLEAARLARIESIRQAAGEVARRFRSLDDASVHALAEYAAAQALATASEERAS
ncbi:MAG: hypothetical protein H6Q77_352 [Gemmatimonadetes bacterium]|nr:hypothetical protein [Gemmatimonadota bacterium]